MKTSFLSILACILLFSRAIFSNKNLRAVDKRIPFKIYIEQNGIRQTITNNTVLLDKKSFNLVFVLHKPSAVLVNASFDKTTYERALKKEPLSKLPGYEGTGMAEGLFNTDKELFIDDTAPSYWYYDNDKEHRFNKVVKTKDSLVCTREIKQFYILEEKDNIVLPVEKVSKPLYLVFDDYVTDPKTYERTELQREIIKINWK